MSVAPWQVQAMKNMAEAANRGDHLVFYCMFLTFNCYHNVQLLLVVSVAGHGKQVEGGPGAQNEKDGKDEGAA